MRNRLLTTALVSIFFLFACQFQMGASTPGKYAAKANAAVMVASPAPEATCSCGFDCGSNNCTFDCEGDFFGCVFCIGSCCQAAKQAERCIQ